MEIYFSISTNTVAAIAAGKHSLKRRYCTTLTFLQEQKQFVPATDLTSKHFLIQMSLQKYLATAVPLKPLNLGNAYQSTCQQKIENHNNCAFLQKDILHH